MENVPIEQWAQSLWRYAHVMASALPVGLLSDALKQSALAFVYSLCHLIPCETCRDHYNTFVKTQPPMFDTGESVQLWFFQCHNNTNRLLNKPEWTINQLKQTYPPNGMYPETNVNDNTVTSLPVLSNYQMVQYKKPERMIGVNIGQVPVARTALPGAVPKGATFTKPKQAPQQFRQFSQPNQQRVFAGTPKAVTAAKLANYNRTQPVNRQQMSYQTQQWRALTKLKTGTVKKKKCSSCSKKRN